MFEENKGCLSERLRLQHQEKQERTVITAIHVSLPTLSDRDRGAEQKYEEEEKTK